MFSWIYMNMTLSHPGLLTDFSVSLCTYLWNLYSSAKNCCSHSRQTSGTKWTSCSTIPKAEYRWENIKLLYNCVFLMTTFVL